MSPALTVPLGKMINFLAIFGSKGYWWILHFVLTHSLYECHFFPLISEKQTWNCFNTPRKLNPRENRETQAVKEDRKSPISRIESDGWQGSRWKKWKLVTIHDDDDAIQWRRGLEMFSCLRRREGTRGERQRFWRSGTRGLFLMLLNMRSSHSESLDAGKGRQAQNWNVLHMTTRKLGTFRPNSCRTSLQSH